MNVNALSSQLRERGDRYMEMLRAGLEFAAALIWAV